MKTEFVTNNENTAKLGNALIAHVMCLQAEQAKLGKLPKVLTITYKKLINKAEATTRPIGVGDRLTDIWNILQAEGQPEMRSLTLLAVNASGRVGNEKSVSYAPFDTPAGRMAGRRDVLGCDWLDVSFRYVPSTK